MKYLRLLLLLAGYLHVCQAMIGFGIDMYKPVCTYACRRAINRTPLECSDTVMHPGNGHGSSTTSPTCFANDDSFLTTLAFCIKAQCETLGIEKWQIERYWRERASNNPSIPAKWTYQEALEAIDGEPTRVVNITETLNYTGIISEEDYTSNRIGLQFFEHQEALHTRYALICVLVGAGLPVLLTALAFFPGYARVSAFLRPFALSPLIGRYHIESLPYSLGNPPTFAQSGYILVFFLLNLFVTALDYTSHAPNAWMTDTKYEILLYLCNRTGIIAFGLTPLVILFSGRNNFLLWITNWSHPTYMLLHRWVARIYTLQVVLHSILEVELYRHNGTYEEELVKPYWIWGIVATVATCIMVIFSSLWFRRKSYELFLVIHIIMAVFVIAGSWYHVELLFKRRWGYEFWIYAACAVWFFDRVVRAVRIASNGILKSTVTAISDEILRIDIPGVRWGFAPGQHGYLYFPGAKRLTFWEAHPFSVISVLPAAHATEHTDSSASSSENLQAPTNDLEKGPATTTTINTTHSQPTSPPIHPTTTITTTTTSSLRLYLRRHTGLTHTLHPGPSTVLLEGPYHATNHSLTPHTSILATDRLLLLTGGIGISATLPYLRAHPRATLYWSLKERDAALLRDVRESGLLLGGRQEAAVVVVKVGGRFDFAEVLREEMAGLMCGKVGVVSCGPPGFCDDVRVAVVRAGRAGKGRGRVEVDLVEEAFTW